MFVFTTNVILMYYLCELSTSDFNFYLITLYTYNFVLITVLIIFFFLSFFVCYIFLKLWSTLLFTSKCQDQATYEAFMHISYTFHVIISYNLYHLCK